MSTLSTCPYPLCYVSYGLLKCLVVNDGNTVIKSCILASYSAVFNYYCGLLFLVNFHLLRHLKVNKWLCCYGNHILTKNTSIMHKTMISLYHCKRIHPRFIWYKSDAILSTHRGNFARFHDCDKFWCVRAEPKSR